MIDNMWVRFTTDIVARVSGPMKFRLVLQPLMGRVLRDSRGPGGCASREDAVFLAPRPR